MKKKKLLILVVLLTNAFAYSQSLQTNKSKDSVVISVKDLDKATVKMIEGKQAKAKLLLITGALSACDSIVKKQKDKFHLQENNLVDLKQQNKNLSKITEDVKILAKNEKSAGKRRGFFGILKGFGAGVLLTGAFFMIH